MELKPGASLSRYRLVEEIGRGGMGVVYRAHDQRLSRDVAVKVLPEGSLDSERARRRFREEARTLSLLNHPNVETVHDFGNHGGRDYLVMELIAGVTLSDRLLGERLQEAEILPLALQLTCGLAAAHAKGIVHRDLKPANLRVTPEGRLKILDFGLAKVLQPASAESTTESMGEIGRVVGTLPYMAPEQLRSGPLDQRTDLYALGVVLYEMATGKLPFENELALPLAADIQYREPVPPRRHCASLSAGLERLILRCLRKDPADRYGSAEEIARGLKELTLPGGPADAADDGRGTSTEAPSIAVLPLADLSPEGDQQYLCDGIAEELLSALAQVPGLRVLSRTSSFQYRGQSLDIRTIGRRLDVRAVLEGSVRKAGDRLRISVQLIQSSDGFHLWSERYDRKATDIFSIQEEIGRAVAGTLRGHLFSHTEELLVQRRPADVEAYDLYLKGRYHWARRQQGGMESAMECFRAAIGRDPSYAIAHAGLADCYSVMGMYSLMPPREAFAVARAEAERALALAPELPEARFSTALVRFWFDWKFAEAEVQLRKALELRNTYAEAHAWLGQVHAVLGRFDASSEAIERALELDPLSPILNGIAGFLSYLARRYDDALEHCRRSLELEPNSALPLWVEGMTQLRRGKPHKAAASLERGATVMANHPFYRSLLGVAYAEAGAPEKARQILAELEAKAETRYVAPFHLASIHIALGDKDRAFQQLERAYQDRNGNLCALAVSPDFDRLRGDPRYVDLVRRVGLPAPG